MAGFLSSLFGGKQQADPNPNPGIGGYLTPRGPKGDTGYPGSTTAVRTNPPEAADGLHDGDWSRGDGAHQRIPGRRMPTIPEQQASRQSNPGERQGGLPWRANVNSLVPGENSVQDTEHRVHEDTISAGTPLANDQRNQVYRGGRQAVPGAMVTVHAAPDASRGFHTTARPRLEQTVTVPSRYVYGGVNGGTDVLADLLHRRMPYTGHGGTLHEVSRSRGNRNVRGAVLDGTRYYAIADTELNQGGDYGRYRKAHPSRPTVFQEPAPWSANFYDTTAGTGGPDMPGSAAPAGNVYVSPDVARRTSWRRGG